MTSCGKRSSRKILYLQFRSDRPIFIVILRLIKLLLLRPITHSMTVLENTPQKLSRIHSADPATIRSAQLTKALGHPVRLAILALLAKRNTCFCGDFTDVLPLAQSTISQHLKVLKETGLINGTTQGVHTCYCLNPEGMDELSHTLQSLAGMFDQTNHPECC